jgi:UDP-GlcNAc:undecaprenyl-phosphate GlcNAc-1-phosphate transferase
MSLPGVIAAAFGLGLTWLLIRLALGCGCGAVLLHRPKDWHHTRSVPVPRLGGAALAVVFVMIEFYLAAVRPDLHARIPGREIIVISSLAMFGLGFWDDLRPLGARRKLLGQILVAGAVCFYGLGIEVCDLPFGNAGRGALRLGAWGPVATVLWLVLFTNLINLIDGLDGLAGGIALMLMLLLGVIGHQSGGLELLPFGMAGALLGFLWFNFPSARVYLGDGGAYFLGFQVGLCAIVNSQKGVDFGALVAPVFVVALPVSDAVLTVVRRGLRGLPLFRPDRNHIHHRLISVGFSPRSAVLSVYGLNLVFLLMGLAAYSSRGKWVPMLLAAALVVLLACAATLRFSRRWFAVHRVVRSSMMLRREIQYALALGRWLELESQRHAGPDELWPDLIFVADKLGFASLKLTLQDEQRVWHRHSKNEGVARRYDCPNGQHGTLEFTAQACPLSRSEHSGCERVPECALRWRGCFADPRVFETISELFAEAWNKSAAQWSQRRVPLSFKIKNPSPQLATKINGFGSTSFPHANGVKCEGLAEI